MAAPKTEPKAKVSGPTSGVMASGAVGKAARKAAHEAMNPQDRNLPVWDRPNAKYPESDTSIDARMWRLKQDHIEMGSR